MNKTAIIIGATGLVGGKLLEHTLKDDSFSKVKIFVRRPTGISHTKLEENIIDFDQISGLGNSISGDVLFSCLGTTLKQAGSKEAQYKVDFTYQYEFAKMASQNGVKDYVLISSTSADAKSWLFYSRIKGELEDAVKALSFEHKIILQPSVLAGDRENERLGEKIGAKVINGLAKVFPFAKKYRSISGNQVAKAMVHFLKAQNKPEWQVYKLDELFV